MEPQSGSKVQSTLSFESAPKRRKIDADSTIKDDENKAKKLFCTLERDFQGVPGLIFGKNFLTKEEESNLLQEIDKNPWSNELSRRVQHYGFKYDYKARTVPADAKIEPLPAFVDFLVDRLQEHELFQHKKPDQLIINEYEPGQGIAAHIDAPIFGDEIVSISLGGPVVMDLSKDSTSKGILLAPRSILALTSEARKSWKHSYGKM